MIEFDRVTFRFVRERAVLDQVDLQLATGSMCFITGPSGAGKSTLLKLLLGQFRPSRGALRVHGVNVAELRGAELAHYRSGFGIVLQDHQLLPDRSAIENVMLPARLAGMSAREARRRARGALNSVGLRDAEHHTPQQLSTGEQQRVGIARALVNRPRVLIADEPTGNLDPQLSAEIMGLFDRLHQVVGTTVLVATHEQALIRQFTHPVLALAEGQARWVEQTV